MKAKTPKRRLPPDSVETLRSRAWFHRARLFFCPVRRLLEEFKLRLGPRGLLNRGHRHQNSRGFRRDRLCVLRGFTAGVGFLVRLRASSSPLRGRRARWGLPGGSRIRFAPAQPPTRLIRLALRGVRRRRLAPGRPAHRRFERLSSGRFLFGFRPQPGFRRRSGRLRRDASRLNRLRDDLTQWPARSGLAWPVSPDRAPIQLRQIVRDRESVLPAGRVMRAQEQSELSDRTAVGEIRRTVVAPRAGTIRREKLLAAFPGAEIRMVAADAWRRRRLGRGAARLKPLPRREQLGLSAPAARSAQQQQR